MYICPPFGSRFKNQGTGRRLSLTCECSHLFLLEATRKILQTAFLFEVSEVDNMPTLAQMFTSMTYLLLWFHKVGPGS